MYKITTVKNVNEILKILSKISYKSGHFKMKIHNFNPHLTEKGIQTHNKILFVEFYSTKNPQKSVSMFVPCRIIVKNNEIYEIFVVIRTKSVKTLFNCSKFFLKEILKIFKTQEVES